MGKSNDLINSLFNVELGGYIGSWNGGGWIIIRCGKRIFSKRNKDRWR